MYRVLIADADPVRACRLEAGLLDFSVKAMSVVSGEMLVAFCRDYELDMILLDLALDDARDAMRLLAEGEVTAGIPIVGIGAVGAGSDGGALGFRNLCAVLDPGLESRELARALCGYLEGGTSGGGGGSQQAGGTANLLGRDRGYQGDALPLLLRLSERTLQLARGLAGSAHEFGVDGPEMFHFVEKSSEQMHRRLVKIASSAPGLQENQLHDREVRHEFRNILASVRGFTATTYRSSAW